jgi:aryl-alcohol dehydrogenase-like predicted oxidoreductase
VKGVAEPGRRGVAFRALAPAGVDALRRFCIRRLERCDARARRRFNTFGVNTRQGTCHPCSIDDEDENDCIALRTSSLDSLDSFHPLQLLELLVLLLKARNPMIEKAMFGRTGHESTRAVFGGAALSKATQEQADQALEVLLRYGINHLDVAAGYGDAELRVAPWLRKYPGQFFLATKTGLRTYDEAKRQIHESLERLGVERFDLIQLHSLADPIEWDTALSPKGALEACIEARDQGLVRFIGVTGHGAQIAATHFRSLERFDFDSVLLPYSYIMMQNSYYADAFERLAGVCQERNVAMLTIKSIARSPWWGRERSRSTWYEPFSEQSDIDKAVHWVLARPGIHFAAVGDLNLLPKVLDAASRFTAKPDDATMKEQVGRLEMRPIFV